MTSQTVARTTGSFRIPLSAGWIVAGLALLLACTFPGQARAAGLNLNDEPDISVVSIDFTYDAVSDAFTASGTATQLTTGGSSENISLGTFNLSATIGLGGILGGGSFTVGGTVPTLGFNSGPVLTGDLTDFMISGNQLEFMFDVTGGDAAGLFGSSTGGILMSSFGLPTDFDFASTILFTPPIDTADIGVVPAPGTLALAGLLALVPLARRARQPGS